ncbi:SIR2 family protein [Isoptericola sp. b441]|uniref:SIR2 family protein n=1 Tax=Actinotalea lenta TaxID=3064654 RepID=A0ABT9DCM5_9CELL|nr:MULTISPECIES: SIR2 family protein [unclassified Isoptericola]MDO8108340.1 SIR2 family protein [Isoptericola sp. b441]MDO8119739.1 SIR2 family protein [Isoptericola sp. b490]
MAGHVFVLGARLEHLDCDAVVIPTDAYFTVEPHWAPALGIGDHAAGSDTWYDLVNHFRPGRWNQDRFGKASTHVHPKTPKPTWFVDVARYTSGTGRADELAAARTDLDALLTRLRLALEEMAAELTGQRDGDSGRSVPLIAVPTLGVAGGGFGQIRGEVIRQLLRTCQEFVAQNELDIAIAAFRGSDLAAFQAERRANDRSHGELGDDLTAARDLAECAREGRLALFLGAGVSMSAGLPSWDGLLDELGRALPDTPRLSDKASPLDRAELLARLYAEEGTARASLGQAVTDRISGHDRYGVAHALLAGLGVRHAVTTNYDQLYERAMADQGHSALAVLPDATTEPHEPWLLKMHGDVTRPESIVLTRADFVGYQARSGPMGSVVQALLMTEHLLVVGSSMTDDNFLRLAHEVIAFNGSARELGTIITFQVDDGTKRLWKGRFRYLGVGGAGTTGSAQARRLAIFLDALAMYASPPLHLLDERYSNLLSDRARPVAAQARELASAIHGLDPVDRTLFTRIAEALDAPLDTPHR